MGTQVYDRFLQGKVDCTSVPPSDYADMLREIVMPISPEGMSQVFLSDNSATSANDAAISVALFSYAMKHDKNYKNLCVLGHEGSSHGNSIATISCSDLSVQSDAPTYKWPIAPLPKVKYPYTHHTVENEAEELRCLNETKRIIHARKAADNDVGAIIVEPITAFGNRLATPLYYKKLR